MLKKISLVLSSFVFFQTSTAQSVFEKNDSIHVMIDGHQLTDPWAGGLNFCQFSSIDVNFDGIKDLFVFDRNDNSKDKISIFINSGIPDSVDYKYTKAYNDKFPPMHRWALLVDYNHDGKEDIFTASFLGGGFAVYKNTSDVVGGLSFSQVNPFVHSEYYPSTFFNLYVSPSDIPAIVDVNNDGDLDALTFSVAGTAVEYHENQSMENHGNADYIEYKLSTMCWGEFRENVTTNSVTLGLSCKGGAPGQVDPSSSGSRHSGSTLLAFDGDNDGDKELILGDISFKNLVYLTNGGDDTTAVMVAQDTLFPSYDQAANVAIFPAAFLVDVNNDGARDLLTSPNEANLCENFTSIWYYKNTGSDSLPVFDFRQNNFLQENMVDVGEGSYPVFVDYNADGLKDIVIGNYGYYNANINNHVSSLTLFKNTGTLTQPEYSLITRNYQGLASLNMKNIFPAFGDLDSDGDQDMMIGDGTGKLHYFKNNALPGDTMKLVLFQPMLQNIDVGDFAAPQLVDVDRDGKLDLLVGNRRGYLNYFRNIGTPTAFLFDTVIQKFGNIDVAEAGYYTGFTTPYLFDNNGNYNLFTGSERGGVFLYNNIDGNLTGNFTLIDSVYDHIYEGTRTAFNGADINDDGYIDFVVGNYAGGIAIYYGDSLISNIGIAEKSLEPLNIDLFPNPASNSLDIKIKNDLREPVQLSIYNTIGKKVFSYKLQNPVSSIDISSLTPGMYFCDFRQDGLSDIKKLLIIR